MMDHPLVSRPLSPDELRRLQLHVMRQAFSLIDSGRARRFHFPKPHTEEMVASDPALSKRLAQYRESEALATPPGKQT